MKKLTGLLVMTAFVVAFGSAAFAASSTIGYIDVQKIFKDYKATASAQESVKKEEKAFREKFDESQKKLAESQKKIDEAVKAGKSQNEIEKLQKDAEKLQKELEDKLAPDREKLMKLNEQLTSKLQLEIVSAVKAVSAKLGVDLVLDKQVVITGGMDLTDLVVNQLNK
jgi:outer membrane protein